MKSLRQHSTTKRIFSGLLAVWMSGVVFLLCCGSSVNAAPVSSDSCPLAKKRHCDKSADVKTSKDEKGSQIEVIKADESAFNCCGFLPAIFDKVKKAQKDQQTAAIPVKTIIKAPAPVFIKAETITFTSYRPPILNRSGTYLKNCVFRI